MAAKEGLSTLEGGLIGLALAAGLIGVYEWDKKHQRGQVAATATPSNPNPTSPGPTNPAPATNPANSVAAALAAQAAAAAEAQRLRDITSVRQQLAGVWNDMDQTAVQLDSIKRRAKPPGFDEQVTADLFKACEASLPASWFFGGGRCDHVRGDVPAESARRWQAIITNDSQPFQAQLSRLDATQRSLISNLSQLGYTVPQISIRSVTQ